MVLFIFSFFLAHSVAPERYLLEAGIQGSPEISLLFRPLYRQSFFLLQTSSPHPTFSAILGRTHLEKQKHYFPQSGVGREEMRNTEKLFPQPAKLLFQISISLFHPFTLPSLPCAGMRLLWRREES